MRNPKRGLGAYKDAVTAAKTKGFSPQKFPPRSEGIQATPGVPKNPPPAGKPGPKDGFIKETGLDPKGYRKAATLLLLLGKDRAAEILKHLSQGEVEGIIREIALIERVKSTEAQRILKEFTGTKEGTETPLPRRGGVDTARRMLEEAFGEEEGRVLFHRCLPFGGEVPFAFLGDLEYPQIGILLKEETPRVISLVLSYVNPQKASRILEELPPGDRQEVIRRMARREKINPEVVLTMEEIFRDRIRTQGKLATQEVDGTAALAGILKFMDPHQEEDILKGLGRENPLLTEAIREKIFTIEDIFRIPDPDFQEVLQKVGDRVLAVIIKGKQPMVREKILGNLSERRRSLVKEESRLLGAMHKREVDEETRNFLHRLREMEEAGILSIPRGDEEYI